jgi:hypothetical protein
MAGGIDWFRWHHGTVTDQKFPLVARRAGASVAEVIAVWACLLERASMNEAERGWLGESIDFEAMDCALGLDDGKAHAIFAALQQRSLVDEALHVSAWPVRQPKRERQDDNSTERSRAFRAKQRQATPETADATPSNATQRTETPRGEESREEKKEQDTRTSTTVAPTPAGRVCLAMRQVGLQGVNPGHPDLLALIEAGATDAEFIGAARTAVEREKGFAYALGMLKGQRKEAASAKKTMAQGVMPTDRRSRQLATAAALMGALPTHDAANTIDMEPADVHRLPA